MGKKLVVSDSSEDEKEQETFDEDKELAILLEAGFEFDDAKSALAKHGNSSRKVFAARPRKRRSSSEEEEDGDFDDVSSDSEKEERLPLATKRKPLAHVIELSDDDDDEESVSPKKKQKRTVEFIDEDDEDDKKKKKATKKKTTTTTTTRKGTKIEFEGDNPLPRTKKAAAAAKKEKQSEAEYKIANASSNNENPVLTVTCNNPVVDLYHKMNIAQLKDWLRVNGYATTGVKSALVQKCVDGAINGRLPTCERCKQGKISFDTETGLYTCSGYFDEDAKMRIKCSFKEPSVVRLSWLDPEKHSPEEAKKDAAAAAASAKTPVKSAVEIPSEVQEACAQAKDAKEVADVLIKYCRDGLKLSIPADDKKARILLGATLMSNRTTDATTGKQIFDVPKVIAIVSESHPTQAEKSAGDSAGGCKVEANNALVTLLDDLAVLNKKKGGENVGFKIKSLKTASIALRGLDYEVTDGLSLGKPGKKKVDGIGKSTAEILQDFLDSGKTSCKMLEKLKKDLGE